MSGMEDASFQKFVNRLTARSALTEEEQGAILTLPRHRVEVEAKRDFVRLNERATSSCLIASGIAARFGQTADGARQLVALHIPGEMADLHSAVRPIGIGGLTALCDTTILHVSHIAIRAICARYPAIAEALWRDCMLDAAILMEWVVNVGRRDAKTRLAHLLCEMASRFGQDRELVLNYALPVTQEHLGDATALTAVHVNRTLKALRAEGLVTHRRGIVTIHDWAGLARLGEFDEAYLVADTALDQERACSPALDGIRLPTDRRTGPSSSSQRSSIPVSSDSTR